MGLFDKYYRDENTNSLRGKKIVESELVKKTGGGTKIVTNKEKNLISLRAQNKKYNDQLNIFKKHIEASGVTCKEYEDLGFRFNGFVAPEFEPLGPLMSNREKQFPMLYKELQDKKYVVKILLNEESISLLPKTFEELNIKIYDTILEKGIALGKILQMETVNNKWREYQEFMGGSELASMIRKYSKSQRIR